MAKGTPGKCFFCEEDELPVKLTTKHYYGPNDDGKEEKIDVYLCEACDTLPAFVIFSFDEDTGEMPDMYWVYNALSCQTNVIRKDIAKMRAELSPTQPTPTRQLSI